MKSPRKAIPAALRPILSASLVLLAGAAQSAPVAENPVFPRPIIVPVPAAVDFELRIDGSGLITTKYHLGAFPFAPPEAHPRPWNDSHFGGFSEVGVSFVLTNGVDRLTWQRKGLWSVYPEDHPGRINGLARRAAAQDDFRGMKEYIYRAAALVGGTELGLQAVSEARDAVRMEAVSAEKGGGINMIVNNEWNYPQLGNSNFMKPPMTVGEGSANTVRVRFVRSPAVP